MPTKKTPIKSLEGDMKTFNKNTIEAQKQKEKDEKAMRKEQAKEEKQQAREAKKQAKEVKPEKPVKKKTAYTSYISQRYAELKEEGKDSKEIFKELAVIWKNMTEEQKAGFKAS